MGVDDGPSVSDVGDELGLSASVVDEDELGVVDELDSGDEGELRVVDVVDESSVGSADEVGVVGGVLLDSSVAEELALEELSGDSGEVELDAVVLDSIGVMSLGDDDASLGDVSSV